MSKKEIQQKLDKAKEALLRNKQLSDEDLEDVFAGFGSRWSSYLYGMRPWFLWRQR